MHDGFEIRVLHLALTDVWVDLKVAMGEMIRCGVCGIPHCPGRESFTSTGDRRRQEACSQEKEERELHCTVKLSVCACDGFQIVREAARVPSLCGKFVGSIRSRIFCSSAWAFQAAVLSYAHDRWRPR